MNREDPATQSSSPQDTLERRISRLEAELRTARTKIHELGSQPREADGNGGGAAAEQPSEELADEFRAVSIFQQTSPLAPELFADFSRLWLQRTESTNRRRHAIEETIRHIETLLSFALERDLDQIKVRAYLPTPETHGYAQECTVVETCMTDQPFILDTLRLLFQRRGLTELSCAHPFVDAIRQNGTLRQVSEVSTPSSCKESMMRWELAPPLEPDQLRALEVAAQERLQQAHHVVRDFRRMVRRANNLAGDLGLTAEELPTRAPELEAVAALLQWLRRDMFVFMAYERFLVQEGETLTLISDGSSRLGLRSLGPARTLPESARRWLASDELLFVGKKTRESEVHRPGKLDMVLVKSLNEHGGTHQVHLISGLFTRKGLSEQGGEIPVLKAKLNALLQDPSIARDTFLQRSVLVAFNSMPVEYLFGVEVRELRQVIRQIISAETQRETTVFLRLDEHRSSAFVLTSIPRERYTNELKTRISEDLRRMFGATYDDSREVFGQHDNVLVYYYFTADSRLEEIDVTAIRAHILKLTRSWVEGLRNALMELVDEDAARSLSDQYAAAFPNRYQVSTSPLVAAHDVLMLQKLETTGRVQFRLIRDRGELTLRMYEASLTPLTESLPILDFMGFEVASESAVEVRVGEAIHYLNTFQVTPPPELSYSLLDHTDNAIDALAAAFEGRMENDRLNRLILLMDVGWRLVDVLRAYISYNRQLVSQSPLDFSRQVCLTHYDAARLLIDLFEARLNPGLRLSTGVTRDAHIAALQRQFAKRLRHVESSSEDKVLRNLNTLIEATLRTNFYQARPYISFKFDPARIPHMSDPRPHREIFVHHVALEGVHLRGGRIARGGLRWSDRYDDYRLEVLGLMTTQQVKNVVIVPVGSKGGFILKKRYADKALERREADRLYEVFISGLLDLTDNIVDGTVVPPEQVHRWDEDDPYLVVAADKGTAHLSDAANKLSLARNFWLGDAFASGGSHGYDHKELGVTSKGAWVSVQRHFIELDIDPEKDEITCVAIGDMSGDVFGNGMLRSRTIKLLGAFNHQHIFMDPTPDPERSFTERQRLFGLGRSTWEDYSRAVISPGGGIFNRTAKAVELTPQMKSLLNTEASMLSGEQVIHLMLKLKADLLWSGGIGTYVKASHETHAHVSDRVNDAVRVDASELRFKVVGEGGNLGLTMAARLEFAARGGHLNTDAVDNSGGVDTSDHEVNLKILLQPLVKQGAMSFEERNALLDRLRDEVCELVFKDNYSQNLLISLDVVRSARSLPSFGRLIEFLEREEGLDRSFEGLPQVRELENRLAQGRGLTRPELSKLMAYAKMHVYRNLMADPLFTGQRLDEALDLYFPKEVVAQFKPQILEHPLKKDIAATYLTNRIIDSAGSIFFYNIWEEANYGVTDAALGYLLVNDLLDAPALKAQVLALDGQKPAEVLYEALIQIEDLLALLTRRVIRRDFHRYTSGQLLDRLKSDFNALRADLPTVLTPATQAACEAAASAYQVRGLPARLAREVSWFRELASGADIALLHAESNLELTQCARLYHRVGQELGLRRALDRAGSPREYQGDWWNKSAVALLRAKLVDLQHRVSLNLIQATEPPRDQAALDGALEDLKHQRRNLLARVAAFERRLGKSQEEGNGVAPLVILSSMLQELI